jgi:hypothetical protein
MLQPSHPLSKTLSIGPLHTFLSQAGLYLLAQQKLEKIYATKLPLSKEEQVRHVISMSTRERDNVSQKLIWYQKMGRMVTLVTELVFPLAALSISLR